MPTTTSSSAGKDSPSAWDALPLHLQERILSLLPVTDLVRLLPVSRHFLSLLRSPSFRPLPSPHLHRLDAFFLLSPFLSFHPLSPTRLTAPPSPLLPNPPLLPSPIHPLPLPPLPSSSYLIAVIPHCPLRFTLVAVTRLRSHVLHFPTSACWAPRGELPLRFALLGNAAPIDNRRLFVLGRSPDRLLSFDTVTGCWRVLPAAMPGSLTTAHLFVFGGRLFLMGGVERFGVVEMVVVWGMETLDSDEGMEWREVSVMPGDVFDELVAGQPGRFWHFQAADRMGLVCLYNAAEGRLVMFDAAEEAWTRLPRVSGVDVEESRWWFGHVIEPSVELLLGPHQQC